MGSVTFRRPLVSDDAVPPIEPEEDWPNLPAGWVIISENDFSTTNGDNADYNFTNRSGSYVNNTEDAGAPLSPPKIGRALYATGFSGGNEPFTIWDDNGGGGSSKMYIGFWFRLSENWVGHSSLVNKIFHLWGTGQGGSTLILSATGSGSGDLWAQMRTQGTVEAANYDPNLDAGEIPRGEWVRWETVIDADTGFTEWWLTINGQSPVKVGARTIDYGTLTTWGQVEWAPTWGGIGGTVPADQYMDMDHLVVAIPNG